MLSGENATTVQVGILTRGRPMLATVIANMVLQEEHPLEIFIVDTGDQPAIKRVDVVSVLRLAQDRGVRCEYEVHRDRQRAFSDGRLKLLESMRGPRERVWELEFLTELFPSLGRTTEVQHETVSYHLDYDGGTRWDLMEDSLLAATRRELNRLVAKYAPATTRG